MTPQQIEALKMALDLATVHHTDDGYAELRAKVRSASKEALAQTKGEEHMTDVFTPLGYTYDSNGNELTYKDSTGYCREYTYDSNGNVLTYKDSDGYWCEYTYDSNGNQLTCKDNEGRMLINKETKGEQA